jgi:hypothetical protein
MVKKVPMVKPEAATMPSGLILSNPTAIWNTDGVKPTMVETVVVRIGRIRSRTDWRIASSLVMPSFHQGLAQLGWVGDIRHRILNGDGNIEIAIEPHGGGGNAFDDVFEFLSDLGGRCLIELGQSGIDLHMVLGDLKVFDTCDPTESPASLVLDLPDGFRPVLAVHEVDGELSRLGGRTTTAKADLPRLRSDCRCRKAASATIRADNPVGT